MKKHLTVKDLLSLITEYKGDINNEIIIRTPECFGYRKVNIHTAHGIDDKKICMIDLIK